MPLHIVSAIAQSGGTSVVVLFDSDQEGAGPITPSSGWTGISFTKNGDPLDYDSARLVDGTQPMGIIFYFATVILSSDVLTVSGSGSNINDQLSEPLQDFSSFAVDNQSDVIGKIGGVSPAQTVATMTTYDGEGNPKPNIPIVFKLATPPSGAGNSYETKPFTVTSDGSGNLSVNLLRSAIYLVHRGTGPRITIQTPDASTFDLPQITGADS